MISKEKFVNIMNRLKNYNDLQEKINDLFEDNFDNIDYWIYDLNYGAKYTKESILDEKGNPIDISTAEKLYDYLIENKGE